MKLFKMKFFKMCLKLFCVAIIVFISIPVTGIFNLSSNAAMEASATSTEASALSDLKIYPTQTKLVDETEYNIEQVTKELFGEVKIKNCEYLYNLDETADYIYVEFENDGYAVFLKQTMELLEYSAQGKLNYPNSYSNKYYGGPSCYLFKENDHFVNTVSKKCFYITKESAQAYSNEVREMLLSNYKTRKYERSIDFDYSLVSESLVTEIQDICDITEENAVGEKPKLDDANLIAVTDGTYIPNYRYFLAEPMHGYNQNDKCGAVAAQLLLSYHNYYSDRRIIANEYLNGSPTNTSLNPNYCEDPMKMSSFTLGTRGKYEDGSDDTNSYFHYVVNNIPGNATTSQVKDGINNILSARNKEISGNINYTISSKDGGWWFGSKPVSSDGIISELDLGRPVLILMQKSLGGSDHYVVAYGYHNYKYSGSSDSYLGYITHFGWGSNELNIWVNSSWCYSYITLKINHMHDYNATGLIGSTSRIQYKCNECGHRTDAAINMIAHSRYEERVADIPQNGYAYKDYYVTFETAGNKLFQTFGLNDVELYLFDAENRKLAYDDNSGYELNSLFCYTVETNKPYILRVQFKSQYNSSGYITCGSIKIGITPAQEVYSTYEDILHLNSDKPSCGYTSKLNTTKAICFTPVTNGTFKINTLMTDDIDTFLYFIDPTSTDSCLYDDDSAGNYQALIQTDLVANKRYFLIVCANDITAISGLIRLRIRKIS